MKQLTFEDLISARPKKSYSASQLNAIKIMTISKQFPSVLFGSANYQVQPYSADLDLHTIVEKIGTVDQLTSFLAKSIRHITKKVISEKLHYITEVKSGLDTRFDVDIGKITNSKWNINKEKIIEKVKQLGSLLSDKEHSFINKIISTTIPTSNDYDVMYNLFREHLVLRWNEKEVEIGVKKLPDNKSITLADACKIQTHIKS